MHDGYGSGSCYLNAALQGIVACVKVRTVLRRHFDLRRDSYAQDLWPLELDACDFHDREGANTTWTNDDRLAVTCTVLYTGSSAQPHRPRLLADLIYDGVQDDADVALQESSKGLLDVDMSPVLTSVLFKGQEQSEFHCACGLYHRPAGVAQNFTSLRLSILRRSIAIDEFHNDALAPIHSVQDAVTGWVKLFCCLICCVPISMFSIRSREFFA